MLISRIGLHQKGISTWPVILNGLSQALGTKARSVELTARRPAIFPQRRLQKELRSCGFPNYVGR